MLQVDPGDVGETGGAELFDEIEAIESDRADNGFARREFALCMVGPYPPLGRLHGHVAFE